MKKGKQPNPSPIEHMQSPGEIKRGLEKLGKERHLRQKSQWLAEGAQLRPGLRQLHPEDLPPDVTASSGYDHRGHCYIFEHKKLGELGRIVLIKIREQEMLMQAELYKVQKKQGPSIVKKKMELFEKVVAAVSSCFS